MSAPVPTSAGWYPDPYTGGTKYWDGKRWTGDTRPRRKQFAAAAADRATGGMVIFMGGAFMVLIFMGVGDKSMPVSALFFVPVIGLAVAAISAYVLRGQGPTTRAIEVRLAAERKAEAADDKAERKADLRTAILRRIAPPTSNDASAAAQINALSNPETAKALQNLQNLLYTQVLTEAEFQAAKDRLLGPQ